MTQAIQAAIEALDDIHASGNGTAFQLGKARAALSLLRAELEAREEPAGTPSAQWRAKGEPDPHGNHYECERAALAMGDLTDDELANGVFLHGDGTHGRAPIEDVVAGRAFWPIAWLTAAKDRIRWLSRKLEEALAASPVAAAPQPAALVARSNASGDYRVVSERWAATHAVIPLDAVAAVPQGCTYPNCNGDQPDDGGCCDPRAYTDAIGQAGEDYHRQFAHAHPLPALWRWSELWDRMCAAAPQGEQQALSDERILHIWDAHVGEPTATRPFTDADKLHFARVVLSAAPARSASTQAEARKDGND
jgi:hypothetical protein